MGVAKVSGCLDSYIVCCYVMLLCMNYVYQMINHSTVLHDGQFTALNKNAIFMVCTLLNKSTKFAVFRSKKNILITSATVHILVINENGELKIDLNSIEKNHFFMYGYKK